MDIKSTSYYRYRYMIDDLHCDENDSHNLSFIGCQYQKENGKYDKGFFNLVHGDKSDIRNYIAQHLKNAEDGQAIYEFLQNAEDAKATSFMAFYNDGDVNNPENYIIREDLSFQKPNKDCYLTKQKI